MKLKYFLYFIIYITLFSGSLHIKENGNLIIDNLPLTQDDSFKIVINYLNGKYYIPMSPKDAINVKIESKNEDLNNYYFKYYYIKEDEDKLSIDDNKYYNESNKIMIIPEVKYIITEMKHKIRKNKIYLQSKVIDYNNYIAHYNIVNNTQFSLKDDLSSFPTFDIDDHFSLSIFFSTFCFATTVSVILIFLDLKEDKKIANTYNLTTKERANQEYLALRNTYINRNTFSFAWFLMKYTYPITNLFYFYNYDHPRYVRFFIILIKMLLNLLISILIFSFLYKKNDNEIVNFFISILYSLLASLIIYIFDELITIKLLGYDKIRKDIWKPKFECLRKYIFYTVKKDILFNTKWHSIRNRMISYTRICENIVLRQKPYDKYKIYSDNKKKSNKTLLNENKSNIDNIEKIKEEKESEEFSEKYMANTFSLKNKNSSNSLMANNMRRKKTFFAKTNGKGLNSFLYIEKGVQSFSISKLGQNNLKLRTVQKIEDIRNRYILNITDSKFDETLEVNSFVKIYDNLEIETLENYTYISTDSMNNQLPNTSSESNKIFVNLIATLIVLILLTIVDFGLIFVYTFRDIKHKIKNSDFIIQCILPVLIQLTFINFLMNYIFSFLISKYIFNYYGYEKNKRIHKMIFKLFVEKYIKYIYRIRLLINKYTKELEFMDR